MRRAETWGAGSLYYTQTYFGWRFGATSGMHNKGPKTPDGGKGQLSVGVGGWEVGVIRHFRAKRGVRDLVCRSRALDLPETQE